MKKATNTPHRIDDYLQRIEARERSSRRKKMMIAGVGVFALLVTSGLYFNYDTNQELRKYSIQELSKEIVTEIFDENDSRIVVAHALGTDTIENLNEYQSLVDLFDGSDVQPAFFQGSGEAEDSEQDSDETLPVESLQKFSIDISGNRVAGNQLVFTIEDYDPDVTYTLSFGTGYKRKVRRVSRYTYNGYGTYRLRLLASSQDKGSSIYTKTIVVSRTQSSNPAPQREVLAEAISTPAPNKSESASDLEIIDGATRDISKTDNKAENTIPNNTETTTQEKQETTSPDDAAEKEQPPVAEDNELISAAEKLEDTISETNEPVSNPEPVDENAENMPLFAVEIMPEFPGGTSGMRRYFVKNYTYPVEAREANIEGTVFVRFVVNADGTISNISVLQGL